MGKCDNLPAVLLSFVFCFIVQSSDSTHISLGAVRLVDIRVRVGLTQAEQSTRISAGYG